MYKRISSSRRRDIQELSLMSANTRKKKKHIYIYMSMTEKGKTGKKKKDYYVLCQVL